MTNFNSSGSYTALNSKQYPVVTDQDIMELYSQGYGYNDIVNMLNSSNVDMAGMRTDMFGGVNKGKSTEEVMTKHGSYGYYDGGNLSPTSGPIQYFMDPKGNNALQAISLAEEYNKMTPEEREQTNMNASYGSEADIFKSFGLSYGTPSSSSNSTASSALQKPSSTAGTTSSKTPEPTQWAPVYGAASKSQSASDQNQEYVPWDAQFGMADSKNGSFMDLGMQDAVGVGFTDTSKGQQFEQVLNSTEKKPTNLAAGPDIFQILINSY